MSGLAVAVPLLLALAQAGGQPPRDRPVAPTTAAAGIQGRVVDVSTGAPIHRAVVTLSAPELPRPRTVRTDAEGRYRFDDLPAGRYAVRASKPRYLALQYGQRRPFEPGRRVLLGARERLDGVDVPLPPAAVISGRILEPGGDPIDRVWVQVFRLAFEDGRRRLVSAGRAVSNDIGQYRLSGLAPGDYYLFAREMAVPPGPFTHDTIAYASTFYPGVTNIEDAQRIRVDLGQQIVNLDITVPLARTSALSGRVVRTDGTPVPSRRVDLLDGPYSGTGGNVTGGAQTDAEGRFRISGVGMGSYQLVAVDREGPGVSSGSLPIDVAGGDQPGLTIVIGPGGTLSGRIVSSSGAPLPFTPGAVLVGARRADWDALISASSTTVAADWSFTGRNLLGPVLIRVPRVPDGWWLEAVLHEGRDITDTPMTFSHGDAVAGVTIVLDDKPTRIEGVVKRTDGVAMADYTVIAFAPDKSRWGAETRFVQAGRPDHEGRFRLTALPPGDYRIAAVEYVETGQWMDPAYLETLGRMAVPVTLEQGQAISLELVSKGP